MDRHADSDDHEADDLLRLLRAAPRRRPAAARCVLTGDRDMYQCATDRTKVLYVKTGTKGVEEVDPDEVRRRYGVPPERVPDFIALRGDPSDGLPGGEGHRREDRGRSARRATARSRRRSTRGRARARRACAGALRDQRDELLRFKDIATLRTVDVELPPDRETDFEGGAADGRASAVCASWPAGSSALFNPCTGPVSL